MLAKICLVAQTGKHLWLVCRAELESVEILCSPEQLETCLASWLSALNSYRNKILDATPAMDNQPTLIEPPNKDDVTEGVPPSVVAPPPPFSLLTPTVVSSVTHLTTLCAELAVYSGRKPEATDPKSEQSLVEFIAVYVELLDWSRIRCLLAQKQWSLREKGWWALLKGGECLQ